MIRVLLVDDHETVREGLKAILSTHPDIAVIGEAADGDEAIAQVRALAPDVVVMDVSMPGLNGLKATEAIKADQPSVHIVILTRHADHGYVQQLFRAGASGYVLKQSRSIQLVQALRAIKGGTMYVDPAVTREAVGVSRPAPASSPLTASISAREEEILRLIAAGYGNKEIAAHLSLSVKTVETHKANVMQKLQLRSRIDVVRFAMLQGWLSDA